MSTTLPAATRTGSGVASRTYQTLPGDHRFFSLMAIVTAVTLLPRQWATPRDTAPVMTISLNGAPGEKQGRNPISGKTIQEAVPETVKPKSDAPPALTKPEMVEPVKAAKPEPKSPAKPE